jgi:tripartite-type tricarboxylate transporter receptor subunit TctC
MFDAHHFIPGIKRRQLLAAMAGAGLAGMAPLAQAQAAWKPAGPVKFVVPYPPGGASDILIRLISPALSDRLGQPVVVENKAGATGSIGSGYVYGAPADGTTLLVGLTDAQSIYPHLGKTTYDPTKFVPVASIGSTPFVLIGRPGLPASNLQELIALARKQPLNYANAGMGGSIHMMTLAFARAAGIDKMLHVPYTGMAPALQGLMANQVDVVFCVVGGASQYRSKLKFFGVTAAERMPAIAEVPTFTEQGVPLVQDLWMGVLAPPNTPAATTATLAKAISEIVGSSAYKAKVNELAMNANASTQSEFAAYYLAEHRKWGELVRASNVKLD